MEINFFFEYLKFKRTVMIELVWNTRSTYLSIGNKKESLNELFKKSVFMSIKYSSA